MLPEERHQLILRQLELHHKVHTPEIAALLKVSLDTVRRDLSLLHREKKLIKTHGGAISRTFHQPFQPAEIYARELKQEIAKKALSIIKDDLFILTGGGTVMLELARVLPEDLNASLFTVSPLVALEAAQRSKVDVMLLAGKLAPDSYICTGSTVIAQLAEIKADLCIIGANGISLEGGLTEHDWEVAQVKKALIRNARKVAVMSISEKLGQNYKIQVGALNHIDYLITELDASNSLLDPYREYCKIM